MTATVVADLSSSPWSGTDRGVSQEAIFISTQISAIQEGRTERSDTWWLRRSSREALFEAFRECSVPGWDGYGAEPADPVSASWAARVVPYLIPLLGPPHYSFDPQGDALLEWFTAPDRVLDLSIGSNGEIRYAATIGGAKATGIEQFADALPPGLLEIARRLAA